MRQHRHGRQRHAGRRPLLRLHLASAEMHVAASAEAVYCFSFFLLVCRREQWAYGPIIRLDGLLLGASHCFFLGISLGGLLFIAVGCFRFPPNKQRAVRTQGCLIESRNRVFSGHFYLLQSTPGLLYLRFPKLVKSRGLRYECRAALNIEFPPVPDFKQRAALQVQSCFEHGIPPVIVTRQAEAT